jgi:hypothetical protein
MYDPCGTQRLEGDDIIKRLALYLKVDPKELEKALLLAIAKAEKANVQILE